MEIQEAIADFSEEILLAYLRYQCEATGIICDSHDFGPYSSDDDALRDAYYDPPTDAAREGGGEDRSGSRGGLQQDDAWCAGGERVGRRRGGFTVEEEEEGWEVPPSATTTSSSVKARARSIDSGVCIVDQRKENGSRDFPREGFRRALPEPPDDSAHGGEAASTSSVGAVATAASCFDSQWERQETSSLTMSASLETSCPSLILSFKKGDVFAVLLEDSSTWWGVMALRTTAVGFVPRTFLKFIEVRHLWLTAQGEKSSREVHMRALSDLQTAASRLPHPEVVYGAMIPEPDYSDDESEIKSTNMVARNNKVNSTNSSDKEQQKPPPQTAVNGRLDDKGLIMPKKLVNPYLESSEKKNLHRELKFNQKMGVNVLNQKTELQKAMEKHNDKKVLKEQEKEKKSQLTPFQKALDERAQKIEQKEKSESKEPEKAPSNEFEKIHAKVRAKMEVQ